MAHILEVIYVGALIHEMAGSGGEIASSVPAEIRVQSGHGGTWIANSVPAQIRPRAQTAYEQAYTPAPLTLLAEPYPWRAETVRSSAHTRAYRAYLGASPAAGDPTATFLSGSGGNCDCCYFEERQGSCGPCERWYMSTAPLDTVPPRSQTARIAP
jgi:hypothetical protein